MAETEPGTPEPAGSGGSTMRSLERAMDVLDALARHEGPMRLADVARAVGLHRATALRILTTLHKRDYVTSDAAGYRIGVAVLAAAHAFLVSDSASRAATPVLQELAATTAAARSTSLLHRRNAPGRCRSPCARAPCCAASAPTANRPPRHGRAVCRPS